MEINFVSEGGWGECIHLWILCILMPLLVIVLVSIGMLHSCFEW